MPGKHLCDPLAGLYRLAGPYKWIHRLVRSAQAASMIDAHHTDTGDYAGEMDRAGAGREHRLPRAGCQIDAAVTGQPGLWRRLEWGDNGGMPSQRPGEGR